MYNTYYVNIFLKRFYRDIEFMLFIHFFRQLLKPILFCFLKLIYIYIYIYIFNSVLEDLEYK